MKKWLWLALGIPLVLAAVLLWIAQSDWLREKVRRNVVEQAEKATGGHVELGAFRFDWRALTAEFDRFVIHGSEPVGDAPLLVVDKVVIGVNLHGDIHSIVAEKPAAHLIVNADGTTNIPQPNLHGSNFDTILNLKIGRFDLRNGTLQIEQRILPWSARGENLTAHATFDSLRRRYTGEIGLNPAHVNWQGRNIEGKLTAVASMERNRIAIASAHVEGEGAVIDLSNGVVKNGLTAQYRARYADDYAEGTLRFAGATDYEVSGVAQGTFRGIKGKGAFEATPGLVKVHDAHATVYGGDAEGSADIRNFKTFTAKGRVRNIQLRYGATVSGDFDAAGNLSTIARGTFHGAIGGSGRGEVSIGYTGSKIEFAHSWIEVPHTRVDLTGTLGERLNVQLQSSDLTEVAKMFHLDLPATFGQLTFEGTVNGALADPRIAGHVVARDIVYANQRVEALSGDVTLTRGNATIRSGNALLQGIRIYGEGSVALNEWMLSGASALTAVVETRNTGLDRFLALAGHKEIPVSGVLSATAQISGTVDDPHASGDATLVRGTIYAQPFDSIAGHIVMESKVAQTLTGLFVSGPKRVNLTARFEHAGTRFPAGVLQFNLTSNTMPLNEIALVRERQPDIHGFGKFHADGSLRISHDAQHDLLFDLLAINADASANGLELGGRNLGDARLTATTKAGVTTALFDSNAANASIHGEGTAQLTGDYPVNGKVTFTNAGLNALAALAMKSEDAKSLNFDGSAEGEMTLTGALKKPESLRATFDVTKLEMHALNLPSFSVTNNGPLRALLAGNSLRIESARLRAPETDVAIAGSVYPLNLQARGSVNLALARTYNPDLAATGVVVLDAGVKGSWTAPDFSGRASLRGGNFHYADFSNGLTNATGQVMFSGTRATIQSFTAESGGGRVDVSGFAALGGGVLAFRIETTASGVRVRYPEGVSSVSDARLTLAGTSQRSQASGTVTIHRVAINPKSDAASILASTAQPVRTPAIRTGLIENVNLDIQIETASDVTLETSVTQTIQADANLRLRGTITNPAILGRINITQGELIFFGNKYSINQGSISFFNPVKIDPILNVDLETKARGVDVILTVTGPVDKLNLSYRSDPPLQFSDIVALLATGRTPGDPSQAVRDTGQSQSFQQLGTSAFLGQAIANPVAGRLQRFFGVSRLKIDPQLTGVTGSPQARLTVEQQVTPDILFTYITDVSSTSTQLIRVEWAYNRHWSAILTREENGYVGLDFAYKKRFK